MPVVAPASLLIVPENTKARDDIGERIFEFVTRSAHRPLYPPYSRLNNERLGELVTFVENLFRLHFFSPNGGRRHFAGTELAVR
jgi:hypothetical protein